MKHDCIYFRELAENPDFRMCARTGTLYKKETEDDEMCRTCRLWDSYIPQNASKQHVDLAIDWQNMSYLDQPDYFEYFGDRNML